MEDEEHCHVPDSASASVDTTRDDLPDISAISDDKEQSIDNIIPLPCYVPPEDETGIPIYTMTYGTSKRGQNVVVDSRGYEYTFHRKTKKRFDLLALLCEESSRKLSCCLFAWSEEE